MPSADTLLADACETRVACLTNRDLLIVIAQSLSGSVGMGATELMDAACANGLACLNKQQLLQIMAQTLASGVMPIEQCTIITESLPDGTDGDPYSEIVESDVPGCTFAVTAGALPDGLILHADGTIDGTPTLPNPYTFTVEAMTPDGATCSRELSITIIPNEPAFGPNSFPGLLAWWKADSFSLPDNTIIGGAGDEWKDQADSNDATTGTNPVLYRTAGIGATYPCLEFANADLVIPNIAIAGDFTIIVVAETTADSPWLGNNAANVQIRRRRSGANNASFYPGTGSEAISDTFGSAAGALMMISYRRTGASIVFWENKIDRTLPNGNAGGFTMNRIGLSQFVGNSNGNLVEITVYDNALADADVEQLYDDYFSPKLTPFLP